MNRSIPELLVVAYFITTVILILIAPYLPRLIFEPPYLSLALQAVFVGVGFLSLAFLSGRSYLKTNSVLFLLLGTSALIFASGNLVGYAYYGYTSDANFLATVYGLSTFVCSLLSLPAVNLMFGTREQWGIPETSAQYLVLSYTVAVVMVSSVTLATLGGYIPMFFVQGIGGTPLRQGILLATLFLLAFASVACFKRYRDTKSFTPLWLSLGVALIADGQLAFIFTTTAGSVLAWTGRLAIILSGLYFVLLFLEAAGEKQN